LANPTQAASFAKWLIRVVAIGMSLSNARYSNQYTWRCEEAIPVLQEAQKGREGAHQRLIGVRAIGGELENPQLWEEERQVKFVGLF
jgi:hypothetical protein